MPVVLIAVVVPYRAAGTNWACIPIRQACTDALNDALFHLSHARSGERMSATAQADDQGTLDCVALVRRIGAGERVAETEFVRAFEPGVRALVRRHCRPGEPSVNDLVQDVLQHVIERLRERALREPEALPAYVRSAVVFAVRADYRRRGRRGELDSPQPPDDLADPDDPLQAARRAQLQHAVRTVLAGLSVERDREILRRHYLEEQDRDTVCAALTIEPEHFRRVLHRARERMRQLLVAAGLGEPW